MKMNKYEFRKKIYEDEQNVISEPRYSFSSSYKNQGNKSNVHERNDRPVLLTRVRKSEK